MIEISRPCGWRDLLPLISGLKWVESTSRQLDAEQCSNVVASRSVVVDVVWSAEVFTWLFSFVEHKSLSDSLKSFCAASSMYERF